MVVATDSDYDFGRALPPYDSDEIIVLTDEYCPVESMVVP
jgi:hypothetical protein